MFNRETVNFTTDASGDATVYTQVIRGRVLSVRYVPGASPATGLDLTITGDTTGTPILTVANVGTSAVGWAPRAPVHSSGAGAALTFDATEPVTDATAVAERLKIVVAEGGDTKTGTIYIVYEGDR